MQGRGLQGHRRPFLPFRKEHSPLRERQPTIPSLLIQIAHFFFIYLLSLFYNGFRRAKRTEENQGRFHFSYKAGLSTIKNRRQQRRQKKRRRCGSHFRRIILCCQCRTNPSIPAHILGQTNHTLGGALCSFLWTFWGCFPVLFCASG